MMDNSVSIGPAFGLAWARPRRHTGHSHSGTPSGSGDWHSVQVRSGLIKTALDAFPLTSCSVPRCERYGPLPAKSVKLRRSVRNRAREAPRGFGGSRICMDECQSFLPDLRGKVTREIRHEWRGRRGNRRETCRLPLSGKLECLSANPTRKSQQGEDLGRPTQWPTLPRKEFARSWAIYGSRTVRPITPSALGRSIHRRLLALGTPLERALRPRVQPRAWQPR